MKDPSSAGTIMVVDDTPANLELLGNLLKNERYRVLQFPRGTLALRAASAHPPDLVLLDIMMPEMDGFEVCRRWQADPALRDIPVIFISALDDTAKKIEAFSAGGVDYVTKPFHKEEVLARVSAHLRLRRQQIEIDDRRRRAQQDFEQLQELEFQRDQLVHMMAHDMRSPLQGIVGFAELLLESLSAPDLEEPASYARSVLVSSSHLQDMISSLLDVSRMESREMPLHPETCSLPDIVEQALSSLGAMALRSRVAFTPPTEPVLAWCDPDITSRIVQNLISNAIKFAGTAGSTQVRLGQDENGPWLEVADSGPGIPPEDQARVFEKFGQVRGQKTSTKYSTGLGLTFCKMATEAQHGRIRLTSSVGHGSTFRVSLPSPSDPAPS